MCNDESVFCEARQQSAYMLFLHISSGHLNVNFDENSNMKAEHHSCIPYSDSLLIIYMETTVKHHIIDKTTEP